MRDTREEGRPQDQMLALTVLACSRHCVYFDPRDSWIFRRKTEDKGMELEGTRRSGAEGIEKWSKIRLCCPDVKALTWYYGIYTPDVTRTGKIPRLSSVYMGMN